MKDICICAVPVDAPARRRWWTCEACGQLWTRRDGRWCTVPADAKAVQ